MPTRSVFQRVYLDYNATAPMLPVALERMTSAASALPGNPSSPHGFGQDARAALEAARAALAARLGYNRSEVIFTSGGSEGNATLLGSLNGQDRPAHMITSPIEHPSVLRMAEWLASRGVAVSHLPVDGQGLIDPAALPGLLRPETRLVSVMAANNETGVIQPLAEIASELRSNREEGEVLLHADAVQAFGRIPLDLAGWGYDACTITAHKIGGPKGIGVLACRERWALSPLVRGGAQERGRRAGTESVFLAEGFAAAAEWVWAQAEALPDRLCALRDRLIALLREEDGFFLNGAQAPRLPNTVNGGFLGVPAPGLLTAMDLDGVAVSSGSACSSGAIEPSHVLTAMGLPLERVQASLRISLGHATTEAEIERCADVMCRQSRRIRAMNRAERRPA